MTKIIYDKFTFSIQKMQIVLKKDWDWFIAEVAGKPNAYAFWYTQEEAIQELNNVVDMMIDYYNEEMSAQKAIKHLLAEKQYSYAI